MTDTEKNSSLPEDNNAAAPTPEENTAPEVAAEQSQPVADNPSAEENRPSAPSENPPEASTETDEKAESVDSTAEKETAASESAAENAPQTAVPSAPEVVSTEKKAAAEKPEKKSGDKADALSGIGLAVSLCDAVLVSVGCEHFHGGIRPDNISVRGNKAYLGGTLQHTAGEFTPQELEYMAPELFWDGIRSPSADVYSIGLILYSLYNFGRLPFWPSSGAITPNARASALQKRMSDEEMMPPAGADAELAGIILRALAFRTESRWRNVQELKDALSKCDDTGSAVDISLAMSGLLTRSASDIPSVHPNKQGKNRTYFDNGDIPVGRRPERRRNLRWLWALILAILAIGAGILVYADTRNDSVIGGTNSDVVEATATAEPTQKPTPTPTPTPEPTASPTPSGPRYVVYVENVSWTQAQQRCEELGGTLAVPMTEDEYNEIVRVCTSARCNYVWLGAERQTDGNWRNQNDEIVGFYLWDDGEPTGIDESDNAPENYLMMWRHDDGWYYNDSRENPLLDFYWIYGDNIGFVCQMW